MTILENGDENKCPETTNFMTEQKRDPIWRKQGVDDDNNIDLQRLGRDEVTSVGYVYKVDERVSPCDATSVEGGLQKNIEEKLNMPHGMCLHREAGAGSRKEYSTTANERKALAAGQKLTYSVVMTMIGPITNPVYADVDPSDPERAPPLLSCTVTSHDGRNTQYRIVVRGDKQGFPETKSVCKDNAAIAAQYAQRAKRHRNDKKKAKKSDAPEAKEMCEEPGVVSANPEQELSRMSDGGDSSDSDEDMGTDSDESLVSDGGSSDEE
jgi:hypothetical protein